MSSYIANPRSRFEEIPPGSLYEKAVEGLVYKHASVLFPAYLAAVCSPPLESPFGNGRPDLILIAKDLKSWAIVEVELEEHSPSSHVQPQIGIFAHSELSPSAVTAIRTAFQNVVPPQDVEQALFNHRRVFLVTHGRSRVSDQHLLKLGVEKIDLRIFRAGANDYLLVVDDYIRNFRKLNGSLARSPSKLFSNTWIFRGESIPEISTSVTSVIVEIDGRRDYWSVSKTSDGYLLRAPHNACELIGAAEVDLAILVDEVTTLKIVTKERHGTQS